MELWKLLRIHAEWITHLREALYDRSPLSTRIIADDEACGVGQWLLRHEASLGHLREYQEAKRVHEQFHRRAAYCVRLANSGHREKALAEIDDHGELRRLSRLLVKAFQALQRKTREQRLPVAWVVVPRSAG